MDHENAEHIAGDLLGFDADDLADPMSRINDEVTAGKWKLVGIHISLSTIDPLGAATTLQLVSRPCDGASPRLDEERGMERESALAPI
jgi:hypothetical protein